MAEPAQPAAVLVRNATIWTAGPQGTLEDADLLVRAGQDRRGRAQPRGAGGRAGRSTAPASTSRPASSTSTATAAILGNVNECTNSVTCEVRIQDVINSESTNIYRQLAGGVTVMHLLHGSCNAIGGQCAVIRNKWGAPPDQLLHGRRAADREVRARREPQAGELRQPTARTAIPRRARASSRRSATRSAGAGLRPRVGRVPRRAPRAAAARDLQLDALSRDRQRQAVHPLPLLPRRTRSSC